MDNTTDSVYTGNGTETPLMVNVVYYLGPSTRLSNIVGVFSGVASLNKALDMLEKRGYERASFSTVQFNVDEIPGKWIA